VNELDPDRMPSRADVEDVLGVAREHWTEARLAALVPRPRAHLVRYHGLFAPIAQGRDCSCNPPAFPPSMAVRRFSG
jgi:hypothetical protein